jgi:hypothetical protein
MDFLFDFGKNLHYFSGMATGPVVGYIHQYTLIRQ